MQLIDCPRCRARFHTGLIYEPLECCPRCGETFRPQRHCDRLRRAFRARGLGQPDWEAITSSKYARAPTNPPGGDRTAPLALDRSVQCRSLNADAQLFIAQQAHAAASNARLP